MQISVRHELKVPVGVAGRAVEHLLLTPLSGPSQVVKDWTIEMPGIETAARFTDAFGNRALLVGQPRVEGELAIRVAGQVETTDRNGIIGRVPGDPVVALYRRTTELTRPEARFVEPFAGTATSGAARIALFHDVMRRIREVYRFDASPIAQTQAQDGPGGMQQQGSHGEDLEAADATTFAHAFIGTLRGIELPARFVTGYVAGDDELPPAFHAWAEAWDDSLGWIAFDAALGLCPTDRHVRIATGLDALSTQPVRAVPAGGDVTLVSVEVNAGQ